MKVYPLGNDSCVDPKRLIVKVVTKKDAVLRWICWIGVISHHMHSLLNAIESIVLYPFICKVGY